MTSLLNQLAQTRNELEKMKVRFKKKNLVLFLINKLLHVYVNYTCGLTLFFMHEK